MRRRLTVAVLLPEPVATEVQGLRRALRDPALDRYVPHITLMPPVNVNEERLQDALDLARKTAARFGPMRARVTGAEQFRHERPVTYLAVDSPLLGSVAGALFEVPFHRSSQYEFVPHITIGRGEFDAGSLCYQNEFEIDRVFVLERDEETVWHPLADFAFAEPALVGRGGLEVELCVSRLLDPISALLLSRRPPMSDLVVVARIDGRPVGIATSKFDGTRAILNAFLVDPAWRGKQVAQKLLSHFVYACEVANVSEIVSKCTPSAQFLLRYGFSERPDGLPAKLLRRL